MVQRVALLDAGEAPAVVGFAPGVAEALGEPDHVEQRAILVRVQRERVQVRALGCGVVATAHLVHLNPFPRNLGQVLAAYERILVPELNTGQLVRLVRAEFLVDAEGYSKVQGLPFSVAELEQEIEKRL